MQKQNRTCEFDGDLTWIWNRLKKQQNQTLRSEALPKDKKLNRSNNPLGPWENLGKRMKASESQNRPGTVKGLLRDSNFFTHFPPALSPAKRSGMENYRYGSGDFLVIDGGIIPAGHHLVYLLLFSLGLRTARKLRLLFSSKPNRSPFLPLSLYWLFLFGLVMRHSLLKFVLITQLLLPLLPAVTQISIKDADCRTRVLCNNILYIFSPFSLLAF